MDFNINDEEFGLEEFIKIFELGSYKSVILDNKFAVRYANKAFLKTINRNCDEVIGRSLFSIEVINDIYLNYEDDIRASINSEGKWTGELERSTSALSIKWDKVTVMSIKNDMDIVKGYVIVAEEISHYKNVSMSFKKCQEHYNCIFEQNHLITLLIDPNNGDIIDANVTASNFYGYGNDEFRKKNISDLDLSLKEQVLKNLNNSAREYNEDESEAIGQQYKHRLANGEIRDVEVFCGLVFMAGKNLLYTVIHDISDRKKAETLLRESEERYRLLVEMSPDAIIVYSKGIVVFANEQASLKLGMNSPSELIGRTILDFIHPDSLESVKERVYKAEVKKEPLPLMIHKIFNPAGEVLEIEVVGAPLIYEGKEAVQIILRDVTERRREIDRAVRMQEYRQSSPFPLDNKVDMKTIYKPAKLLSGDFYLFSKISEDVVIGLLGDVQGKGITAALSISATKVIFNDGAAMYKNPLAIIQYMNREAQKHLDEESVSCICFEMNFKTGIITAVGAGINEFISVNQDGVWQRTTVKGPPIGMFGEVNFEQVTIPFLKGDVFNFYSDGMEFIFDYNRLNKNSGALVHEKLKACLEEKISNLSRLQDDCTWLSIKVL